MLLLKLSLSTLSTHLEEPFELDSNQQFHVLRDNPVNRLKYALCIVNLIPTFNLHKYTVNTLQRCFIIKVVIVQDLIPACLLNKQHPHSYCLHACLHACMIGCMLVYMLACLFACLHACLHACMLACKMPCLDPSPLCKQA